MADLILMDGDIVKFDTTFVTAIVAVKPGKLSAGGAATLDGKLCVAGDESKVSVATCSYTTPFFPKAGMGTLKILKVLPNQVGLKTASGKKKVLLKGAKFIAEFTVQLPAQLPAVPVPQNDPVPKYVGTGEFQTANKKLQGT